MLFDVILIVVIIIIVVIAVYCHQFSHLDLLLRITSAAGVDIGNVSVDRIGKGVFG